MGEHVDKCDGKTVRTPRVGSLMGDVKYMQKTIKRTLETTAEEERAQLALIGYDDYPEIIIEGDTNKDIAVNLACAYLEDLRLENLAERYQAEQQKIPHNSNEYRRLINVGKAIQMLIENKEKLSAALENKLEGLNETDQYELIGSAFSSLFLSLYELFDKCRYPVVPIYNNSATNSFAAMAAKKTPDKIDRYANGKATFNQGTVQMVIESYNNLMSTLRPSTAKLLDVLAMQLTKQNTFNAKKERIKPDVEISLSEYAELKGMTLTKSGKDKLRQEASRDLEILRVAALRWGDKKTKKRTNQPFTNITSSGVVKNSVIYYRFNLDFAHLLVGAYTAFFPLNLFLLDERNVNLYAVGRKLFEHYCNIDNVERGINNIIGITTILEVCNGMPTYEEVMMSDRRIKDRIILPVEKILNVLKEVCGYSWEYCGSKKATLTEEQREGLENSDYSVFKTLYIHYEIPNMPNQTERIKKRIESREQRALTSKKKATAKSSGKTKPNEKSLEVFV